MYKNRPMTRVSLRLPGMYNVLNSLAVSTFRLLLTLSLLLLQRCLEFGRLALLENSSLDQSLCVSCTAISKTLIFLFQESIVNILLFHAII